VEQLCQGVIDLFIDELYQYQQFVSALNIFSLPYTFHDVNQQQIFLRSSYFRNKVLNTLLIKGVQFLNSRWNWFRGLEWVLVSTRPIFTPGEIKGLRVRIYESETLSRFWEYMGANPVIVPWPKVKESLQKEEIDVVATRKSHVYPLEFCRYARYVTLLGDVSPVLGVGMNEVKYQTLPPSIQNSLKDACDAAGDNFTEHIRRSEKKNELLNISRFKAAYLKVDDAPWRQAVSRARNKLIEEDLVSREIWEEINRCRHKRGDL
jgi:C4-dicarboxylate-binding protein DctP